METMTLHIRLTKACNADCSYCSSWQESPSARMSPDNFKRSIQFIWDTWSKKGIFPEYLTIEYVGGEILLIPSRELKDIVYYARSFFKNKNIQMKDGVQSNLIGSKKRLGLLYDLFQGRVGTSIDNTTDQRTIKGSREDYRVFFRESDAYFRKEHGASISGVFTLDRNSISGLMNELSIAKKASRNITIRPVFEGGTESIDSLNPKELGEAMIASYDYWLLNSQVMLEPHGQLLLKWLSLEERKGNVYQNDLCPFQNNCAKRSLSLEPNGDLYVCQELGDTGDYRLGNAIYEDWIDDAWNIVSRRPDNLHNDCKTCPYLAVCQGGCMMQAIQDGNGPFGKPNYCQAWKMIFRRIEESIHEHGRERIKHWLQKIS